jgi:hypothetical protein
MALDVETLKRFFAPPRWQSTLGAFPQSGFAVAERVRGLRPRFVVDAGCGYNEFKRRVPNLIGIDIANPAADLVCDITAAPIRAGSIDVVLALGSINFGGAEDVLERLRTVASWLSAEGVVFMRGNPGEPIGDDITIFPWSSTAAADLGRAAGLALLAPPEVEHVKFPSGQRGTRLFWVYRRAPA